MEIFQSVEEGKWFKINKVELTESEQTLLKSTNENDAIAKTELLETIKSKRFTSLTATKSKPFIGIYDRVKPTLKESDVYELIAIDISVGQKTSGILNCRINGEHKQIRF
jgi:transcriptional regulator with GAF, ATPase, and Fis domain